MALKEQNADDDKLVWAIVDSGSRRLVGRIAPMRIYEEDGIALTRDVVPCVVYDAIELHCNAVLIPAMTPQGPGLQEGYQATCTPVDHEVGTVDVTVYQIANLRLFADMEDKGVRYKALYDRVLAAMLHERAKIAGIQAAQTIPQGEPKLVT